MIHVKKILYPTDFSTYSNQAYFHAVGLAETYGASLTVVYVYTPGSKEASGGDRRYWRSQLEQVRPANPDIAAKIREGKVAAAGALVGAVMKATRGQADAAKVRELILARLS